MSIGYVGLPQNPRLISLQRKTTETLHCRIYSSLRFALSPPTPPPPPPPLVLIKIC